MTKITDDQKEIFDIVDKNDTVVGQATRGEVHRNKNLIHRSVGVCVFNKKGAIFLQKRSSTKDTDPSKWTISCSGHVLSGATRSSNPQRRIFQTRPNILGSGSLLQSIFTSLKRTILHLGRSSKLAFSALSNYSLYKDTAHRELKEELGVDLRIEFVEKYLCRAPNEMEMSVLFKAYSNGPFKLHPQEIEEGKFFTQKELKEALSKKKIKLSYMGKVALEKIGFL